MKKKFSLSSRSVLLLENGKKEISIEVENRNRQINVDCSEMEKDNSSDNDLSV